MRMGAGRLYWQPENPIARGLTIGSGSVFPTLRHRHSLRVMRGFEDSPWRARAISADEIEKDIRVFRGRMMMMDADLARLYGVPTRVLNQAVRRNRERFPVDFMIQLSRDEFAGLRSQFVISKGRGGSRYRPF